MAHANDDNVFVYTGEGAVVPYDVVRVRIDPSVLVIPHRAFSNRSKMETIELHDGLREIGQRAFCNCRALNGLQLSDGVDTIGSHAFSNCVRFTKFRSPPLVTTIPYSMLFYCTGLFSLELPEIIIEVKGYAFGYCYSLRNVALASNTVVGENNFQSCHDLLHIFDTVEAIVNGLRNRFDGQFIARCTTYHITPWIWKNFAI